MSAQNHSDSHCHHINARGHRCRSLLAQGHDSLCSHHLAQCNAQSLQTDEALANELLSGVEDFSTAASVNRYLGNLLKQIARKRIHRRDAIAQAYVCQLLLNSLPALDRQRERENPEPTAAERHAEFLAQLRANMLPGRYPPPSASTDPGPEPESHDDLQPAYEGHR